MSESHVEKDELVLFILTSKLERRMGNGREIERQRDREVLNFKVQMMIVSFTWYESTDFNGKDLSHL